MNGKEGKSRNSILTPEVVIIKMLFFMIMAALEGHDYAPLELRLTARDYHLSSAAHGANDFAPMALRTLTRHLNDPESAFVSPNGSKSLAQGESLCPERSTATSF